MRSSQEEPPQPPRNKQSKSYPPYGFIRRIFLFGWFFKSLLYKETRREVPEELFWISCNFQNCEYFELSYNPSVTALP